MYILITTDTDGDSYKISTDLSKANEAFEKASEECLSESSVYLLEVEEDTDFGFGAYGDIFGGKVIRKYSSEEE